MRGDRKSTYESFDLDLEAALRNELRHGLVALDAETVRGAQRFAGGAGRHGSFDDGADG
jgi:enoyl-CoA hydratase